MDCHAVLRVMGIDPGLAFTGYGVVDADPDGGIRHVVHGIIPTVSSTPFVERLSRIHRELESVFQRVQPHHVAVEEVYFAKHPQSALLLGHARGAAILTASLAGVPVFEYAATETKKAVCTYGHAGKEQVCAMVKALLRLQQDLPDHASDALALCICHIHCHRTLQHTPRSMDDRPRRAANRNPTPTRRKTGKRRL
jgi:crossover junction endodeoxyribonuclease RuvC